MIANPVGIDFPIQEMQQLFIANLWTDISASKKEFNHRVFSNKDKDGNNYPEVFIDGTNDYRRVKFDDRLSVLSWFDVSDSTGSFSGDYINQEVGVFFAVNLKDLYPTLQHRAVEESHKDVNSVLLKRPLNFSTTEITTRDAAYGDFNIDNLKKYNIQPWHVFRIKCNVKYQLNC
jgi:hypothetical protein